MDWSWVLVVGAGLVGAWLLLLVLLWARRPRGTRLADVARVVPEIARLVADLIRDPGVPLRARVALVALLAWLANPIDLVPEFIPILGPLDDVIVAVLVLRYVVRRVGEPEVRRRWRGTAEGYELLRRLL